MKFKLLVVSLLATLSCNAQGHQVEGITRENMINAIGRTASSIKSLECDFVQTKHLQMLNDNMVSKGQMYYKQGGKLRWEYLSPYNYIFVMNGNKVMLKSNKRKDIIDVKSSKLFNEIAGIMMNSLTGQCLSDYHNFAVIMYDNGDEWTAVMFPRKKEIRQMFQKIVLTFSQRRAMVTDVQMIEKSGDTTYIRLKNVKSNTPINEKVFDVD